jgi:hypothetical protein
MRTPASSVLLAFAHATAFVSVPAAAQSLLGTRTGTVANGFLGQIVRGIGDHDGDGIGDFVVGEPGQTSSYPGRVYLISGATRATLATFVGQSTQTNQWGFGAVDINPIGDANGDGKGDFAIGMNGGVLDVFSGLNGARLYRLGPALEYYQRACCVGDFDSDGKDDFVAQVYLGGALQLWVVRGVAGTQLLTLAATSSDGRLRDVGDQNGDGHREIAVIAGSTCDVYNLHPPGLLRRINFAGYGSSPSIDLADWNGDGRLDVAVAYEVQQQPFLFVHSLATGVQLRSLQLSLDLANEWPRGLATLGDFDLDGSPEAAVYVYSDAIHTARYGHIAILSGRTGRRLGDWAGSMQFGASSALAGLGDVDGDGFHDFAMGIAGYNGNRGAFQVISGRTTAAMLGKPSNCFTGPFPPTLGTTRPVLGSVVTIAGRDAPLGAPGMLVLSLMPAGPANLGVGGCDAWFDLGSGAALAALATTPDWSLQLPLPNVRPLVGIEIALQALYFGTSTPIGLDLTNGVWGRLGH